MKMTKEKILKAIGSEAWDKIKKLAFGAGLDAGMKEETLANGTVITYEGELGVGTEVLAVTPDGGEKPLPDWEYKTKEGATFTVKNGVITEYRPAGNTQPKKSSSAVKNSADLKEKIETMRIQQEENLAEMETLKKQFSAIQAENNELRQHLSKISRVLEILVETTPDEPVRNHQFIRNTQPLSKAERIASLLKN